MVRSVRNKGVIKNNRRRFLVAVETESKIK